MKSNRTFWFGHLKPCAIILPFLFLIFPTSCYKKSAPEDSGRKKDSLHLFNKVLEIFEKSDGNEPGIVTRRVDSIIPSLHHKGFNFHIMKAYAIGTLYCLNNGDSIKLKQYMDDAKKIALQHKNDSVIWANYLALKGTELYAKGRRDDAYRQFHKSMQLFNKKDSGNYYNCLSRLSSYSIEVSDYETALSYVKKIHLRQRKKNAFKAGLSYENMGVIYGFIGNAELMEKYLDSAQVINDTLKHEKLPYLNTYRARLEFLKKNYQKSLDYYNKENGILKKIGFTQDDDIDVGKAKAFEKLGMTDSTLAMLKKIPTSDDKIIGDRQVAKDYYPLKLKHSKGEDLCKTLINYNRFLLDLLEQRTGFLTFKLENELEKQKVQHVFNQQFNEQRQKGFMLISISIIITLLSLIFILYLFYKKKSLEAKNKEINISLMKEKFEAITKERDRISKELHDDLGATFTSISLATQMIKKQQPENLKYLQIISNNAVRMNQKINEIVWSLNTHNDNIESLTSYIINFSKKFLETTSITLIVHRGENLQNVSDVFIPADKRRIIYLTCKEIINNAVKHANAKEIKLNFDIKNREMLICISDNGTGVKKETQNTGNGFNNIKENMKYISGEYLFETSQKGTKYTLKIKI